MTRPNLNDNPEYAILFKTVLEKKQITTSDLLKSKKTVERKNILRKMNNLESRGIVSIEKVPGQKENRYYIDYSRLAVYFSHFLFEEFRYIKIWGKWKLLMEEFSDKEAEEFEAYIRHYTKRHEVLVQKTIRNMFYQLIMESYPLGVHEEDDEKKFKKIKALLRKAMEVNTYFKLRDVVGIHIKAVVSKG
ncbi:MAG: hypothetical protein V1494_06845 [Candidatus Diapherotrites archaeon]